MSRFCREMLFISRLKRPWSCFPSHFCFLVFVIVIYRVVSIVSHGRNQSSFVFFYVVFGSLYGCVNAVSMLASPLPSSFLGTYSRSMSSLDEMPRAWSLVF